LRGRLDDYLTRSDEALLRLLQRPLTPTPGVAELLARVRWRGVRLALASSSRRSWVDATPRAIGLHQAFEVVLSADDVRRGKPAPDLFLLAARRLGLPAEQCIVIEDSPNGLRAGRRAGMTVAAVRRPEAADLAFVRPLPTRAVSAYANWRIQTEHSRHSPAYFITRPNLPVGWTWRKPN
jgi:HAD superfamily hydrolase (TIGR01509 family)